MGVFGLRTGGLAGMAVGGLSGLVNVLAMPLTGARHLANRLRVSTSLTEATPDEAARGLGIAWQSNPSDNDVAHPFRLSAHGSDGLRIATRLRSRSIPLHGGGLSLNVMDEARECASIRKSFQDAIAFRSRVEAL